MKPVWLGLCAMSVLAGRAAGPSTAPLAIDGLLAAGPAVGHAAQMQLFGQSVGDWDLTVEYRSDSNTWQAVHGEWHFGWILQGRAIQDVWIAYRPQKTAADGADYQGYGTTVRVYDAREQVWHVHWMGVLTHSYVRFRASRVGDDIVMNAVDEAGQPMQWIFSDISPRSFSWRAQSSADGGRHWQVQQRMRAVRRGPANAATTRLPSWEVG